jgi:hypothetical protein
MKLTVDPEFEALCPALDPDELRELEHSLETSEQLSPILYWTVDGKNLIIDGHNRHRILSSWGWRDEQFMVSGLRFVTRLEESGCLGDAGSHGPGHEQRGYVIRSRCGGQCGGCHRGKPS